MLLLYWATAACDEAFLYKLKIGFNGEVNRISTAKNGLNSRGRLVVLLLLY